MSRPALPVVWMAGAPCTGKSTAAWELYTSYVASGRRVAYVDIDQLGMVFPALEHDPQHDGLKARVVGRTLRNFSAAGAESAIVSGVVDPDFVADYRRQSHGSVVTFVRLRLDRPTLTVRLRGRYGADDVAAALELDARLDAADFDSVVDTTGLSPAEVAERAAGATPAHAAGAAATARDRPVSDAAGICVWVHGAPAVGKSTVAWELFRQLIHEGGAGYLDVAQLSFFGGLAADDQAVLAVQAANVAAAWDAFADTGARWLVMSGALPHGSVLDAYRRRLPHVEFRPVQLTATDEDLRARVFGRGDGNGPNLAGDLLVGQPPSALDAAARAAQEEARRLAGSDLPGPAVDTTGASVLSAVAAVRIAVGI